MRKYWVGQLGESFFVYNPNGDIVAFRPDQGSAEKARDALNAAAEEAAKVKKV